MATSGFDYFTMLEKQAGYSVEMACNLKSGAAGSELGTRELLEALHTIENDADQVNHEIHEHLLTDFVVPLERESLDRLANALDDVVDTVEDIAIGAYMLNCVKLPDGAWGMLDKMVEACMELQSAVAMLSRFNHDASLIKKTLVKVQTFESDCDWTYIEGVRTLYQTEGIDPIELRRGQRLFELMENAMDTIEHAAEAVESAVALNV